MEEAIGKLESIVYYHNKNLTKSQYYALCDVLETLQQKERNTGKAKEQSMEEVKA